MLQVYCRTILCLATVLSSEQCSQVDYQNTQFQNKKILAIMRAELT